MRFSSLLFLLLVPLVLLPVNDAEAAFAIAIDDPATQGIDIIVEDNGDFDVGQATGSIESCIEQGSLATCVTAISKPVEGTATLPQITLNVEFLSYSGAITIMASDTGFSSAAGTADVTLTGFFSGGDQLTASFYGDTGNQRFTNGFSIATLGPLNSPQFTIFEAAEGAVSTAGSFTVSVAFTDGTFEVNGGVIATLIAAPENEGAPVPDVVGLDESVARNNIDDAGFDVGTVSRQASETVMVGNVISQTPTGGTVVPLGSQVDLVVSTGSEVDRDPITDPFGLSGVWFDPATSGEGFTITGDATGLLIYYFGRDGGGGRLWLVSNFYQEPLFFGESFTVTMSKSKSGTFADPDPQTQEWGTATFIFDSCENARVQMNGDDGFKQLDNLIPLATVGNLVCDD